MLTAVALGAALLGAGEVLPRPLTDRDVLEEQAVGACALSVTLKLMRGEVRGQRSVDCFGPELTTLSLLATEGLTLPANTYTARVTFEPGPSPANYSVTLLEKGRTVGVLVNRAPAANVVPSRYFLDRESLRVRLSSADVQAVQWGVVCLDGFDELMSLGMEVLKSFALGCQRNFMAPASQRNFPQLTGQEFNLEAEAFAVLETTEQMSSDTEVPYTTGVNVRSASGRWLSIWSPGRYGQDLRLPRVMLGKVNTNF